MEASLALEAPDEEVAASKILLLLVNTFDDSGIMEDLWLCHEDLLLGDMGGILHIVIRLLLRVVTYSNTAALQAVRLY